MLPEERHNMIVQIVNELGAASVKDLSARFKMTEDSIRKDLTLLQKRGWQQLKKSYKKLKEGDKIKSLME